MDAREYWQEVGLQVKQLEKAQASSKKQPQVEAGALIYIMSLRNKERNSDAGVVSLATHKLAAECIVKNTHRVATDNEIDGHIKHQEQQYDYHKEQEVKRRAQFVVQVGDPGVGGRPSK